MKTPVTVSFAITLAYLNELRTMNNKQPLKAWKESKDKLANAIDKEHAARIAAQPENLKKEEAAAEASSAAKARTVKRLAKEVIERTTGINVAAIAKELGINPKVARAKLRKAKIDRTDAAAVRKALAK